MIPLKIENKPKTIFPVAVFLPLLAICFSLLLKQFRQRVGPGTSTVGLALSSPALGPAGRPPSRCGRLRPRQGCARRGEGSWPREAAARVRPSTQLPSQASISPPHRERWTRGRTGPVTSDGLGFHAPKTCSFLKGEGAGRTLPVMRPVSEGQDTRLGQHFT